MIHTSITETFHLSSPILSAGMASEGGPLLAAAVSSAGGMGFIGAGLRTTGTLAQVIRAARALTVRPIGVDFLSPLVTDDQLKACLAERPAAVAFSRYPPSQSWIERLRDAGLAVWLQTGSPAEARKAARRGADGVIVQAHDMGRWPASASLVTLIPAITDAVSPLPVIAAGGIHDGRGLAATLMLGADAVWCDTRFLASKEANLPRHRSRAMTERPRMRPVLSRQCVETMDSDDSTNNGLDLMTMLPTVDRCGGGEGVGVDDGESVCNGRHMRYAADIVREMSEEASLIIDALQSMLLDGALQTRR